MKMFALAWGPNIKDITGIYPTEELLAAAYTREIPECTGFTPKAVLSLLKDSDEYPRIEPVEVHLGENIPCTRTKAIQLPEDSDWGPIKEQIPWQ